MDMMRRALGGLRASLINIATLDSSPRKIALGVAVGMFVGMLPITGLQTGTGLLLSFLLRVNKVAVVLSTQFLCNPLTLPFLFFFNLKVGEHILAYQQSSVSLSVFQGLVEQISFGNFLEVLANIAKPLYLGSIMVAPVAGVIGYGLALTVIRSYRRRRPSFASGNDVRTG